MSSGLSLLLILKTVFPPRLFSGRGAGSTAAAQLSAITALPHLPLAPPGHLGCSLLSSAHILKSAHTGELLLHLMFQGQAALGSVSHWLQSSACCLSLQGLCYLFCQSSSSDVVSTFTIVVCCERLSSVINVINISLFMLIFPQVSSYSVAQTILELTI